MTFDPLRSKAALWAGAGVLAMAGIATSLAAPGSSDPESTKPETAVGYISAVLAGEEPQPFEPLAEAPEPNEPEPNDDTSGEGEGGEGNVEALVLGVPEDSPACENVGCGEVENAGGVTLHLPQPAVDGINRAAENRANAGTAGGDGEEEPVESEEPTADEESGDGPGEATAARGVPAGTPACEIHGCVEVETPGGVTVNVPQPAADGMARAEENRNNARNKNGGDDSGEDDGEEPVATSSKGKPAHAGPPAGKGPKK